MWLIAISWYFDLRRFGSFSVYPPSYEYANLCGFPWSDFGKLFFSEKHIYQIYQIQWETFKNNFVEPRWIFNL